MSGGFRRRLEGLDAARGVALLGMVAAHAIPEVEGSEFVWDGRSSILFATVAGVSLGLLSGGRHTPAAGSRGRVARVVALRAVLLVVLGIALVALETPIAIILDTYGFLFAVAIPLLFAPRWLLAVVAAAAALLGPWVVETLTLQSELAQGTTREMLDSPWAFFPQAWVTGVYPAPVWLAYLAVGILIARCDLRSPRTQIALVAIGSATAAAVYLVADALGDPVVAHSDTSAEVLASGGVAVAVIGLLVWLTSSAPDALAGTARRILYPVSAAGS
ncbi:MAG: hypothetical protein Q7T71_08165, partial [Herbiconiux sp.]|nr:hypothetical protein [Herbiconiux sp.]